MNVHDIKKKGKKLLTTALLNAMGGYRNRDTGTEMCKEAGETRYFVSLTLAF